MMKFSKVRPKNILRDFCTMETHTYIMLGDTHMFDENIKKSQYRVLLFSSYKCFKSNQSLFLILRTIFDVKHFNGQSLLPWFI